MADVIGRAVLEIAVDNSALVTGLNQLNQRADESSRRLKSMGESLNLVVFKEWGEVAVDSIKRAGEAIIELGVRGARVASVREAFAGLSQGVHATADEMLGALRRGVQGTVSDFDLMQAANKALGSGLKLTTTDMGTLAAGAKMLADRTGKEEKDAFEALTKAMITGRTKGLAEFGLGIKDAHALLGELNSQLKQSGEKTGDFKDYVEEARAQLTNLRDTIGVVTARALPDLIAQFKGLSFGGTSLTEVLKFLANVLANGLVNAAGIGVNTIKNMVEVVQAGASTISTHATTMWNVLTGKMGVKEALLTISTTAKAGLDGIRSAIQAMLNPTITWKNYLADVGKVATVVSNQHAAAGAKIKKINTDILISHDLLNRMIHGFAQEETQAEQTAAAAITVAWQAAYNKMKSDAMAWSVQTQSLAAAAGFKTRDELEHNARVAAETYQRMKDSGLYTTGELQRAHEAYIKAKEELDGKYAISAMEKYQMISEATSSILRTAFGKNKAAAIAATLIDAAAAIVKVFAQYGFPWGIPMAAAIAVKTGAEIGKIKSQGTQGFASGTPGLDFQAFGTVSPALLHGEEAVVPRGKGHVLASEIAAALPRGSSDGASLRRLDRIASGVEALPAQMKRAFRDGLVLARA